MQTNDQVLNSILEDKKESQSDGSDGGEGKSVDPQNQAELVTLPDGRQVTAQQAAEEYRKLQEDYTKKSQELSELKRKGENSTEAAGNQEQIKEQLRNFGVVFKEDVTEQENRIRQQFELKQQLDNLASKIDGSDGRPAFKPQEVIAWMQKNQIFTPNVEQVYETMHSQELAKWRALQIVEAEKANETPGTRGTSTSGGTPSTEGEEPKRKASKYDRKYRDELKAKMSAMLTSNSQ